MKLAILGCGNLGTSIAEGLLLSGNTYSITATRRNTNALSDLGSRGVQITADNCLATKDADVIILGFKPYTIHAALAEIKSVLNPDKQVIVSLASGVTLGDIDATLGLDIPVYRAMPNIAAEVQTSMTCIASVRGNSELNKTIQDIFNTIGISELIEESLMNAATALGACGTAFVLRFMRAMTQAGIEIGFSAKTAEVIVEQTVIGAAKLMQDQNQHPEALIDKVTTPKGCTIAGLNEMEHQGFSSALIKGILTSYKAID